MASSGSVASGAGSGFTSFSGYIASGQIVSGMGGGTALPALIPCVGCGKPLPYWVSGTQLVDVWTDAPSSNHYCFDCAGYAPNSGGFSYGAERHIRMGTPFRDDTPWQVVVDWLQENGKIEAATLIIDLHREPGDE